MSNDLVTTDGERTFALLETALKEGRDIAQLVAMQERIMRVNAEMAYASALQRVQAKVPPVYRDAMNEQTRSRYARLEKLHGILRPIYTAEGFSMSFDVQPDPRTPGWYIVTADVLHAAGHSRQYHMPVPVDDTGIKGSRNKTALHGMGSSVSYARRYLESTIFGVVFTDEDDDGQQGGVEHITEDQAADLLALADEVGADVPRFLLYIKADSFETIRARDYQLALRALEAKRRRQS